jgi:hypothetical protein
MGDELRKQLRFLLSVLDSSIYVVSLKLRGLWNAEGLRCQWDRTGSIGGGGTNTQVPEVRVL